MRRFTYLLFSLISILATAQDSEKAIREQFTTYSQLVVDKKIDAALDYTNEDLFKVVPREPMKSLMESIFNMPTMEYRASMPQISEVGPVKNIDGASYAKIKYTANLEMKFLQAPDEEKRTAKEEEENSQMLLAAFESKYGRENVSFDKASGFYKIVTAKTAIAKSSDLKNWKFAVIDNPKMMTILEKFIPKEMLE